MDDTSAGIYQIRNVETNQIYIGSAVNLKRRWGTHKTALKKNKHHSTILQNSYNKYGINNFKYTILIICSTDNLLMYEQRCLDTLNPYFNVCKTAGSCLGKKHSDEARQKNVKV